MINTLKRLLIVFMGWTFASVALADWQVVADESLLAITSTKNQAIVETHSISGVSGKVSSRGNVAITVDLTTLESNIPIRNQRMQAMLFAEHPKALFTAGVRVSSIQKLEVGQKQAVQLAGEVTLNGIKAPLTIPVVVTRLDADRFQVAGGGQLLADQFGFSEGLEALRNVAMLQSISPNVTYSLLITLAR